MITNILNHKDSIDSLLQFYLPKEDDMYNKSVVDAMRYSVNNGGKRVRPLLVMAAFNSVKANIESHEIHKSIQPFMVAIEMIHTYSLIHDDLPAMDDDELRRGKPTCHIKFGEANAILAGDGLLNLAFEIIGKRMVKSITSTEDLIPMVHANYILGKCSGIKGMIGGQSADMLFESVPMNSEKDLQYIHDHKTGALLTGALQIGGLLGKASEEDYEKLSIIGKNIGLAFQIQDDILDKTSTEDVLGKPIGSDEKNHKSTYLSFHTLEEAVDEVGKLNEEAIRLAKTLTNGNNELLLIILQFLKDRNY